MRPHAVGIAATLLAASAFSQPTMSPDPTFWLTPPKLNTTPVKLPPDADWVWTRQTQDNQTVYFRKAFDISETGTAKLYITADDYFTAYINGQEVGHTGAEKDNDFVWAHVHQFDVSKDLQPGKNVIAVVAQNQSGPAGLLARLEVNGKPVLFSDYTWMQMETQPPDGWMLPNFQEHDWTGALRIASVGGDPWGSRLEGWPVPVRPPAPYLKHLTLPVMRSTMLKADADPNRAHWLLEQGSFAAKLDPNEEILVDFGRELTGRVAVTAEENAQVQICTGESAQEAMIRPWTTTTVDLTHGKPGYSIYNASRYAVLRLPGQGNMVHLKVSYDHLYYPVAYRGVFDCSDPLLTKIWYTGAYTAHSCMQEDIWDAPKRDRMRWMGDLHVSGEVINNVFLDKFLMEHTLSLLREDAQGGNVGLPKNHVNGIPGYSCAWVCGLADFYRHVGDLDYIRQQHDALITMVEFWLGELDDQGLFANKKKAWPFVDWAPKFDGDSPEARAATHMFFVKALHEASFLLEAMGDKPNADKYGAMAKQLTVIARGHLVQNGMYGDRRQENAMAIYSGVATLEQTQTAWDQVLKPGSPAWNYIATPYYNNYVIFAMSEAGHTPEALDFVRSYWGGMLAEGATTFWEAYDPKWDKNDFHKHLEADGSSGYFVSLCHGWSAGATNFLTERILGVRPTSGGFATCDIDPQLCGLKWARGDVPTPHGNIRIWVQREPAGQIISLHIPEGVRARFVSQNRILKPGNVIIRMK